MGWFETQVLQIISESCKFAVNPIVDLLIAKNQETFLKIKRAPNGGAKHRSERVNFITPHSLRLRLRWGLFQFLDLDPFLQLIEMKPAQGNQVDRKIGTIDEISMKATTMIADKPGNGRWGRTVGTTS
ncbi:MAG: hypothetical protein ACKO9Z_06320 [Planctomycetota bacterium]